MAFTTEAPVCLRDGLHIRGHSFRGTDTPRPAVILCHAFPADARMCCGYDGSVLFLQGTADRVVPLSYPRKAAELYSDCRYHEISGGTHCFTGDADAEACRLIAEFMGKIRKDARS